MLSGGNIVTFWFQLLTVSQLEIVSFAIFNKKTLPCCPKSSRREIPYVTAWKRPLASLIIVHLQKSKISAAWDLMHVKKSVWRA